MVQQSVREWERNTTQGYAHRSSRWPPSQRVSSTAPTPAHSGDLWRGTVAATLSRLPAHPSRLRSRTRTAPASAFTSACLSPHPEYATFLDGKREAATVRLGSPSRHAFAPGRSFHLISLADDPHSLSGSKELPSSRPSSELEYAISLFSLSLKGGKAATVAGGRVRSMKSSRLVREKERDTERAVATDSIHGRHIKHPRRCGPLCAAESESRA